MSPKKKPQRSFTPKFLKPADGYCTEACPLTTRGTGYVPAYGQGSGRPVLLVGEGPWYDEVALGEPLVGASGSMLSRVLALIGRSREEVRLDNVTRCFPGDTLVAASGIQRGYRRWYTGPLTTVTTREGVLSGTPNHPVLTSRGWVPMHALVPGDDLVRGTFREGVLSGHPHIQGKPARFDEFYNALTCLGVRRGVVGRDVDFHGDGRESEVDVVTPDSLLGDGRQPAFNEQALQEVLEAARTLPVLLERLRETALAQEALLGAGHMDARGSVGGRDVLTSGRQVGLLAPRHTLRSRVAANLHPDFLEGAPETVPGHVHPLRDGDVAFPTIVGTAQIIDVQHRDWFAGHVYNLQTESGEYIANGFIVHNCACPGMEVRKFPGALTACQYLDDHIREDRPRVIVPLGGTALTRILQLGKVKNGGVENFHGTVSWSALHQAWVVPTYHPSHLQRGATNLMGVVAFDLTRAFEVAEGGWAPDPAVKVIDPPVDWFAAWVDAYVAAVQRDGPYAYPLGTDIETPEKGADEGTLIGTSEDATYQIIRVNVSCHPDEGVTVPYVYPYIPHIHRVLEAGGVQYYWYKGYDYPRLVKAGAKIDPRMAWDCMWMWKALQSDLPAGLGFAAPFYSRYGAWKHLSESAPGEYAAVDGFQTRRVGDGCVSDLVAAGRWDVFLRHMHEFHRLVLQPSTDVGVPIDRARLAAFKADLDTKTQRLLGSLQACLPEDLLPLTPKEGLTRPPVAELLHTKARTTKRDGSLKKEQPDPLKAELYTRARVIEKDVLREVLVCQTCGTVGVIKTHNCQPKLKGQEASTARPILTKEVATVRRFFWQEPFNPDSPKQVMAYILAKGHEPGKSKQTGEDAADRETLGKLAAQTGDPFYHQMLQYRAVGKVRGTYVLGTEKRLDTHDRVHPTTTFKPSTMRTSQVNPNLQNVVADKGGGDSLAAGFRMVVVARGRMVEEGSEYADV